MGANEVEAVRAFCVFVRATGLAWNWIDPPPDDVAVRSMVEVGRVLGKIEQGMEACAIATPKGPIMVAADGTGITASAPWAEPVRREGKRIAGDLYFALVDAGGPVVVEPDGALVTEGAPSDVDDALAASIVASLQEGRRAIHMPDRGLFIEESPRGFRITKNGEPVAIVPYDAWDLLRSELADLLAE